MTKTIGVIGVGSIGQRHVQNIINLGHKCVYHDKAHANELTAETVIKSSDAVVISCPSDLHLHYIEMCADAGKPMLVEKPLATEISDKLRRIIATSNIMVGNNLRYHPVIKEIKGRLLEVGKIELAWFYLGQKNNKYTDPVIMNWGAHEVDLARYLVGDLQYQSGAVAQDTADIVLKSTDGVDVDIHLNYLEEPYRRDFTLHGNIGSIHGNIEELIVNVFTSEGREIVFLPGSIDQTYVEEMQEFIRRVDGRKPDGIGATGADGLRCLELLLEAKND